MNDNEKRWYSSPEENPEASWYTAGADIRREREDRQQKRVRKKTISQRVFAAVMILALTAGITTWLLRPEERKPAAEQAAPEGSVLPDPSEIPDVKEYFDAYYTAYTPSEPCTIERIPAYPSLELTLSPAGEEELSYREIYEKCAPSLVAIRCYKDKGSDDSYYWGSGILFTEDGFILTNSHLVEGTCRARVILWNDEEYDALFVGNDSSTDLAILKIDAQRLTPAQFGDAEALSVGDSVVAIGNPLGETFRSSMTEGIIYGIDRDIHSNGNIMTLLQTSTPINEGNSGGALINRQGQVIGITNMKMNARYYDGASIEGLGLAIPIKTIKPVADALLAAGQISRPALGIVVGPIPEEAKEAYGLPNGLYITSVSEHSDCAAKGIEAGDILLTVNGSPVSETADVTGYIEGLSIGDSLDFTLWRDGETYAVTVHLVERNDVY